MSKPDQTRFRPSQPKPGLLGTPMQRRLTTELDGLRSVSQLRSLQNPSGINLCSNDYLGLSEDIRLKEALLRGVEAVDRVGSTGSRLLSGNHPAWEELETAFAVFAGTEAALYFSSGYNANLGLLSSLLKPGDLVFSDALNHASIIDGIRLSGARKFIYSHCDLKSLERALRDTRQDGGTRLVVTESVFSMEGDIAPLAELLHLARTYDADLIVDEAHATGVCGPEGRGLIAELGCQRACLALVHTCGKALASAGAVICCGHTLKEFLINRARSLIFSTAAPPYLAHQIRAALALARTAEDRRAHLRELGARLRERLAQAHLDFGPSSTHIVPVILGPNELAMEVASHLQKNGFAVRAVRPPTVPPGTSRLRLSLTSKLALPDIERLVGLIQDAMRKTGK
jgi:8-amino-7-oxononanoate synthase